MHTHADKKPDSKTETANNLVTQRQKAGLQALYLTDNRPASVSQQKLIQRKENNTGLPDQLKTGVENLSGLSMDDVKVHYSSNKPAQLNAHAYAQGTDIHIASGQEKHLPHEAWHVAQQKQGRVKPTMQMKGKVNVNNDKGLEKEADVMGAKAIQGRFFSIDNLRSAVSSGSLIQKVGVWGHGKDKDGELIVTENLVPGEKVRAQPDEHDSAKIVNFIVDGKNRANYLLKHYMVINNGTMFQLPIKYILQPKKGRFKIGGITRPGFNPNSGDADIRGGQPEGFGGTDDLKYGTPIKDEDVATRRDVSLNKEYKEENHHHDGATINVVSSKKFALPYGSYGGMAGTISIAATNRPLVEGPSALNDPSATTNRGRAEMAGSIVINCDDLINGVLRDDALEAAIGSKIEIARNNFHADYGTDAPKDTPFDYRGGILAHLVGMMKDEILAQRALRNAPRILPLMEAFSRQHDEKQKEIEKKKIVTLFTGLGLIALLMAFFAMFSQMGSDIKEQDL